MGLSFNLVYLTPPALPCCRPEDSSIRLHLTQNLQQLQLRSLLLPDLRSLALSYPPSWVNSSSFYLSAGILICLRAYSVLSCPWSHSSAEMSVSQTYHPFLFSFYLKDQTVSE